MITPTFKVVGWFGVAGKFLEPKLLNILPPIDLFIYNAKVVNDEEY